MTGAVINRVLVAAIGVHLLVALTAFVQAPEPAGDSDRYYEIATAGGRPYIDYEVEQPIGTWLMFKAVASLPGGRAAFGRYIVVLNTGADAVIVLSLLRTWGIAAAAWYAVVVSPLSALLFNRIDFWSMAVATLAVAAWRQGRSSVSAGLLIVGASLKLWPLVLATSLLPSSRGPSPRPAWRPGALIVFVLGGGAAAAVTLWLAGGRSVLEVLTFRGTTGWQIESVVGSVLHLIGWGPIRLESGSWRIGTTNGAASIALFVAAAPLSLWASWRGFQARMPGKGWVASVSVLLSVSALVSPGFIGWLVPGGALAWIEGNYRPAVLTACAVLLTEACWFVYADVLAGTLYALALVVIRNVVVVALAIDAGMSLLEADLQPQLPAV